VAVFPIMIKNNVFILCKNKLFNSIKNGYKRFLEIRGNPKEIALGFALGLFIGMTPTIGFHTPIAVFLAALLKWNKISAAVGIWITNPLTAPFIYSFNYYVGANLLGISKKLNSIDNYSLSAMSQILKNAPEIMWALFLGGFVLGIPLALMGYFFSYSTVKAYRKNLKKSLIKQKKDLLKIITKKKSL